MVYSLNSKYDVVDEIELSIDMDIETGFATSDESKNLLDSLIKGKPRDNKNVDSIVKAFNEHLFQGEGEYFDENKDRDVFIETIKKELNISLTNINFADKAA